MKPLLKLIHSLWFVALLFRFGLGLAAGPSKIPASVVANDGQTQATILYDAPSLSASGYDVAPALPANERQGRRAETSRVFARCGKFLAADSGVWRLGATTRGTTIENRLATTEYSDWFRAGQLDNGTFPLIDFQKGNNLVSLKTVDTTGSTWLGRMQGHIDDLATRGATVNGNPANMILDTRVQPGGAGAAQQLIGYGQRQGVTVIVKEFP